MPKLGELAFSKAAQVGSGRRSPSQRARADARIARAVREEVLTRDRDCRFPALSRDLYPCDGPHTWAHLPSHRRARTMGQAPESRHTRAGSLRLCLSHHTALDAGALEVRTGPDGADGRVSWYDDLGLLGDS